MRRLVQCVAILVAILLTPSMLAAQDNLREWFRKPYSDPESDEYLAGFHGIEFFNVGDMLFAYGYDCLPKQGISDLSRVESVAETVERGAPDRATAALIDHLLQMPHAFYFEEIALKDYGSRGLLWHITWTLRSNVGGGSGIPYRYTALMLPDGKVISPMRALYDKYVAEPDNWVCSLLSLAEPGAGTELPGESEILDRARRALEELISTSQKPDLKFRFVDQRRIEFPVAVATDGSLQTRDVWAVDFASESREPLDPEVPDTFTIWVSESGEVADLKLLPLPSDDE